MSKSVLFGAIGASLFVASAMAAEPDAPASASLPAAPAESASTAVPGAKLSTLERFAPSGVEQKIVFLVAADPDCTSTGSGAIRVLVKPQHGSLQMMEGEDFGHWAAPNIREKCNDRKLKGTKVIYKPDDNYTGDDKVSLLFITADAFGYQYVMNLHVW